MGVSEGGGRSEFDHAGFVVPDLGAAVQFFTDQFGASVEFRLDRFIDETGAATGRLGADEGTSFALAMLRLGSGRIELLQWWPCSEPASAHPNVVGAAHIAIDVDDAHATLDRLRSVQGVAILSEPVTFTEGPTPGLTNAFVTTPWGLLVEILSWNSTN